MKMISTHSHLLTNPKGLDTLAESGIFSSVWLLDLPHEAYISEEYTHPATSAEVLQAAKDFPGFYLPFKWVDYRLGPEQIDQAVDAGFVGFKGICPQYPYDDERYMPIYERIAKYKTAMVFHTGYVNTPPYQLRTPGFFYQAANMRPATLRQIACLFPDMMVIAAHFGCPWEEELLYEESRASSNLYIDLSGGQFQRIKGIIERGAMLPADLPDGKCGIFADRWMFGADAYLGHPQLHEDTINYCKNVLNYFEQKKAENVPWKDKIPAILSGNAEFLVEKNALIRG